MDTEQERKDICDNDSHPQDSLLPLGMREGEEGDEREGRRGGEREEGDEGQVDEGGEGEEEMK
jgi:hypothetical protein